MSCVGQGRMSNLISKEFKEERSGGFITANGMLHADMNFLAKVVAGLSEIYFVSHLLSGTDR